VVDFDVCFRPRLCEKTKLQESVVILFAIFLGAKPKVEIQQASLEGALPKWRAVPSTTNSPAFSHSLGQQRTPYGGPKPTHQAVDIDVSKEGG